MISSVSAYEINDVEGNKHGQGKQAEFLCGKGGNHVDGHLRAIEFSLQLPDELHVRVHNRLSLVQKFTLWGMLVITVGTVSYNVLSIPSGINLLVHARSNLTQTSELTAGVHEFLHHNAHPQLN